jgi:hypothetical protein
VVPFALEVVASLPVSFVQRESEEIDAGLKSYEASVDIGGDRRMCAPPGPAVVR